MTRVIVLPDAGNYSGVMRQMLARLLLLVAVLLMPFGMTPAAAMAHEQHSAAAAMPAGHCPEQAPRPGGKAGFIECTMVCSAALPASDLKRHEPRLIVCVPVEAAAARQLHGLHPDTATPPPRRS